MGVISVMDLAVVDHRQHAEWLHLRMCGDEWQRVATSGDEWQRVARSGNEWLRAAPASSGSGAGPSSGAAHTSGPGCSSATSDVQNERLVKPSATMMAHKIFFELALSVCISSR